MKNVLRVSALSLFLAVSMASAQTGRLATTTTLTVSSGGEVVTSASPGTVITLTATVMASGAPVQPGQVDFCDAAASHCTDIHLLGVAQLIQTGPGAGTAALKFTPGVGSHVYEAVFLGTTTNAPSTSGELALTITGAKSTTTTIAQSGDPGNYTLTATVVGNNPASPSGTVSFLDTNNSNYVLGTAELSGAGTTGPPGLIFFNPSVWPTNPYPQSVAVADFNGDGKPDLFVPVYSIFTPLSDATVLLGNGDGTFKDAPNVPAVGQNANNAAVADFNGDGNADIALSLPDASQIQVLLGKGDGTFSIIPPIDLPGVFVYSVAAADLNGDGNTDLIAVSCATESLVILLGNGDGTFTEKSNPDVGGCPSDVAVGDFNDDGIPDLAVPIDTNANGVPGSVTILLGKGDGTFTAAAESPATGDNPISIATGDFNGDGVLDLAVANLSPNISAEGTVTVLLGKGDGTFTQSANPAVGFLPYSVQVGDFNGDGKADLATANAGSNTVTVLLGNGDGTFPNLWFGGTNSDPIFAAVADFNGDGISDLAVANNNINSVTVLLTELSGTGIATATVNGISVVGTGVHLVDASYSGDSDNEPSISATTPLTAERVSTMLSLSANQSSSKYGQQILFTAKLTPNFAQNHNASGVITFYTGNTNLGTGSVSNGVATLTTTALPIGSDSVTAAYPGDTNFAPSTSPAVPIKVISSAVSTTTSLTAVPESLTFGQTLTLIATVAPASGPVPTGTVTFYNGAKSLAAAPLASGTATLSLTPAPGTYLLTASYGGSSSDAASTSSPPIQVTVIDAATTTTLSTSLSPAPFASTVTFIADVRNATAIPAAPTPVGTVSFYDGTTLLNTATLASGVATYSTSTLTVGSHDISAVYPPGAGFDASTSNLVVEVISIPEFSISASPPSRTVYTGQAASYTVTVTPGTGFNLPVALSCSQLPANTTCSFSPVTVPGGSGSSVLVVQTTAPSQSNTVFALSPGYRITALAGLLLLFIPRRMRRVRKGWPTLFAILGALTASAAFIAGCGGSGTLGGGTPVGTQTVTISGTTTVGPQTLARQNNVTLNVQSLF